ncbi:NADH-quinone oxidoreductase subunit C [Actinoallomurus sp. NPDC050550]|uniref:hydrogenase large subunit n=1 Tax=Actinoallomurus sp. NPDC050550 TaxID=3154937 RepID=UPI0033F585CC
MPSDNKRSGNRPSSSAAGTHPERANILPPSLNDRPVVRRTQTELIEPTQLHQRAAELLKQGYRLALVAAHHDTPEAANGAAIRVVYLFVVGPPDTRVELHLHLDPNAPALPTLAALSFPAGRFEREMRDLYGVVPLGHPLPRRLLRHPHWPRGWYPMRADAGPPPAFGDPETPYPFRPVEGPGTYEIPVGPVHAGLIEPGHFRFTVVGETILKLKARLWFTHKGTEKLFEGHAPARRVALAERISGDTAVGHALAYCLAVEDAAGVEVLPEAARMRAILLELERLHNHITDIGALCNDVGHAILHAHALRIRETLLRLNLDTTGHRLLRGGIILGGANIRRLPDPTRLEAIGDDIRELVALALSHTIIRDRFTGTAVLTRKQAFDLGTLGYVARASGLSDDARVSHPFSDLGDTLTVPTRTSGDVLARFLIRADEIDVSLGLITELIGGLNPGYITSWPPITSTRHATAGTGIVEGWRGTIAHRVELDGEGRLTRVKIVDPSFFNWPAIPVALKDTIVPDFPLTNKSFNLSYAGNDL